MTVLGNTALTLTDWAKRLDPDGKVPVIVEALSQVNEILDDMLFIEGNLPTGHRTTIRTGLPAVYWRLLNQGVIGSKSTTAQVDEGCAMLEAWSKVDKALAELGGNPNAFRLSEAGAFIEAMSQAHATALFYGNSSINPEQFNGLSIRYSSKSAPNAQNIVDAGGVSSDNSSIWLVGWGSETCHGIFPKGSMAGLEHKDLGEQMLHNVNGVTGANMLALVDKWNWSTGAVLKDWRYVTRIANIDMSNLASGTGAANLLTQMTKATHRIHNLSACTPRFYMNRSCFQALDLQRYASLQAGGGVRYDVVDGERIPFFRNIPIKICDSLIETETQVS